MSENETAIRIDITPSAHPGNVSGEGQGAQLAKGAMKSLYECYGRVNDVAGQVKDMGRLAQAARPHCERAVSRASQAIKTLQGQVEHLDHEIATTLRVQVEPGVAAQIRSHWAGKKTGLGGITKAIESGDDVTASAILHAPAYLAGITNDDQALLRVMAGKKFAPEKTAQRAETAAALGKVEFAMQTFVADLGDKMRAWSDADSKLIEEGLRGE